MDCNRRVPREVDRLSIRLVVGVQSDSGYRFALITHSRSTVQQPVTRKNRLSALYRWGFILSFRS